MPMSIMLPFDVFTIFCGNTFAMHRCLLRSLWSYYLDHSSSNQIAGNSGKAATKTLIYLYMKFISGLLSVLNQSRWRFSWNWNKKLLELNTFIPKIIFTEWKKKLWNGYSYRFIKVLCIALNPSSISSLLTKFLCRHL